MIRKIIVLIVIGILSFGCNMKDDHRINITIDELNSLQEYEDEEFLMFNYEEKLIHPVFEKIGKSKSDKQLFSELTDGQKALWTLAELNGQINNGGIAQYFWNSQGKFAADATVGLTLIGENKVCPQFREAIEKSEKIELTFFKRTNDFSGYATKLDLNEFDSLFLHNAGEIQKKMIDFIKSHPDQFIK
jgi:hypothetical protein